MRVAVIGANGQLGTEICKEAEDCGHEVIALTHDDICVDVEGDMEVVLLAKPDAVINTAAVHSQVACGANPRRAYRVNVAQSLCDLAHARGWYYLYVSTDYVFEGMFRQYGSSHMEDDPCRPLSIYSRTKLAGELAVQTYLPENGAVCQVSTLFGAAGCRGKGGGNLVDRIVTMAREGTEATFDANTWVSPTYAVDAAVQILRVLSELEMGNAGVFHCANAGGCSHWTLAQAVAEEIGCTDWMPKVHYVNEDGDRPVLRTGLANTRLELAPNWRDGLRRYIAEKYGKGA